MRLELRDQIESVMKTLTPREEHVLTMRFLEDQDLPDVAAEMGVTPQRVQQIQCKALRKLRHPTRSRRLRPFAADMIGVNQQEPNTLA